MKKWMGMLLVLIMVFTMAASLAEPIKITEDFNEFDVTLEVPAGLTVTEVAREGWVDVEMRFSDPASPKYDLHINPSEEYVGLSLADLPEEELDAMVAMLVADFEAPEANRFTTPSGNMVLFIRETFGGNQYATMQTLYRGFFFYLYCAYEDFSNLTDADIEVMHKIIEGLELESLAEPMLPPDEEPVTE